MHKNSVSQNTFTTQAPMKCIPCSQSRYAMKVRTGDDFLEQIPPNDLVMKSLGFGRSRRDFVTDRRLWVSVHVGMSSDKWRGTDPCSEWYTVESTLCWMRFATDSQCSSLEIELMRSLFFDFDTILMVAFWTAWRLTICVDGSPLKRLLQ